jgi:ferredoxin
MKVRQPRPALDASVATNHLGLREQLEAVSGDCTNCGLCRKDCLFLKDYGTPGEIADRYGPGCDGYRIMPFKCSLCRLCTAVCPVHVDPARLFLEMRREAVDAGAGAFPEHRTIRNYERRGTSRLFTWYGLPPGCTGVFFPGCGLSGTRPAVVRRLYRYIGEATPALGIVLDCCTKPSHDLGDQGRFQTMFSEMKGYLLRHGVRDVIVACPNCYRVFKEYGGELGVRNVYEYVSEKGAPGGEAAVEGSVTVHDSCSVRFEDEIHRAARSIVEHMGIRIEEMRHSRRKTVCCGEGGSVGYISRRHAGNWTGLRKREAAGRRVVTYCAGCASALGRPGTVSHLLDLICEPGAAMKGAAPVSRPPFTYLNRLRLKWYFRKTVDAETSRERPRGLSPLTGHRSF